MSRWAVFISYVDALHDTETKALKDALEAVGIRVFRFQEDVPFGAPFNLSLADALLGSQVVVAFLDAVFLDRPNCRWELNAVLAANDLDARLVVARPSSDSRPSGLAGVPPTVANRRWPSANETAELIALVLERLAADPPTLAEALGEVSATQLRAQMIETSLLPAPELLTSIPHSPDPLPASINEAFVGRSEMLWRIDHVLRLRHGLDGGARSMVVLEGGGGTGKTRVAREYVRRYGSHYQGGIYWIDGSGQLDEQLHAVLRVLDQTAPDLVELRGSQADLALCVRQAFQTFRPRQPVLWVVDGVPEMSLSNGNPRGPSVLEASCPLLGQVALLLTSRVTISTASQGVDRISVRALPSDDAVALLKRGIDVPDASSEQWALIAQWVGRLPLALTLLNAALAAGTLTLAELATRAARADSMTPVLDSTIAVLRNSGLADLDPGSLRGVSDAFAISYGLLDDESRLLLRLLAELAPDPLPEPLLQAIYPQMVTAGARTALRTRSFVEAASGQAIAAFGQIHVLVADFVRSFDRADISHRRVLVRSLDDLFDPDIIEAPASWPVLNALLPHGIALCQRAQLGTRPVDVESVQNLELRMAAALASQGSYTRARLLEEHAVETSTLFFGPDHAYTLQATENLAFTLHLLGEGAAATEIAEGMLEKRLRLLGPDHPDTLRSEELASVVGDQSNHLAVRTREQHVLETRTRVFGAGHIDTLGAAMNLAVTLRDQTDPAARSSAEGAYQGFIRLLGPDHRDTLKCEGNLASILYDQGDYPAARRHEEHVLDGLTNALGSEHPETLKAAGNLATTLKAQGELEAAHTLQEHAFASLTRLLGADHPDTLRASNNLANTLKDQGEYVRARALAESVIETRTRLFGTDHPDTIRSARNLAAILVAQHDLPAATRIKELVLEACTRRNGERHPDTLKAAESLAKTLHAQDDSRAQEVQAKVLEAWTDILGFENAQTLEAAEELAIIRGLDPEALLLQERVLQAWTDLVGFENEDTLRAADVLAIILFGQSDRAAARALLEKVIDTRTRVFGADHPDTVRSVANLAMIDESDDVEAS
jgi:tetratricopeptide (TPR) repeat protein